MSDLDGPKKETVRITLPPRPTPGGPRGTTRISLPAKSPLGVASSVPGVEPPKRALPPPPPPARRLPSPPAVEPVAAEPTFPSSAVPLAPVPPPPPRPEATAPPVMPPRPRILPPPPRVPSPGVTPREVTTAPSNYPGSGPQAGPRKETARITILPEPISPMTATVKMAKTQPLLTVPAAHTQSPPVVVAAEDEPAPAPGGELLAMLEAVPLPICWTIFAISTVTLLIQIWNYFSS